MDGRAAIEWNRLALKRIVAALIAVAGLDVDHEAPAEGPTRPTLPRHLWLAILRLLRPAEAAARRLIIAAARGITVTLPPPRKRKTKPVPAEQVLRRFGIAVTMPAAKIARAATAGKAATAARPRSYCLPLLDPLRVPGSNRGPRSRTVPAHAAPRIMLPGIIEPYRLPSPPSPGDPVSAVRLNQRLAALAAALDDLPGQARRFARWKARRDARLTRRVSPLRPGQPPGGRLSRFDAPEGKRPFRKIREVDEILAHAHALALAALESPDTS
jgi:hypothetical protein